MKDKVKIIKTVWNKIIPLKKYAAVNIFGCIFIREELLSYYMIKKKDFQKLLNHEAIHSAQMRELLYIGFYIIYCLEWLFRVIFHTKTAYRGLSFEKEAYNHESDMTYLQNRKHFAQWRKVS